MFSILLPFYFISVCSAAADMGAEEEHVYSSMEIENAIENKNIEDSLRKIENIAILTEKFRREGVLSSEQTDESHNQMVVTLEDLTEQLKDKMNAYKFLNSKGFDRIVTPIIGVNHGPLKQQLLILIKTLFNVAPITTNALIPISIVDKLLDIFENDDNLALKAHALDILHIWLPNNPTVQVRVMKLKGLEPFYNQISKLDNTAIQTLVDLFNEILTEHIRARKIKSQKNKEDYERMQLYQTIGLVERMSTPQVCNGLLNILEALMTFNSDDRQISPSIFELVKNIKPFCLKIYKGKDKAIELFDQLYKYVANWHNRDAIFNMGLNTTEVITVIEDYAFNLKEYDNREEL